MNNLEKMDTSSKSGKIFHCDLCNINCTGNIAFAEHIKGRPHYKALQKQRADANGEKNGDGGEPPQKKAKMATSGASATVFVCETCDVGSLSKEAYESHLKGVRHLKKLKQNTVKLDLEVIPHIEESPGKGYKCTLCNVDNLSGKPVVISHVEGAKHQHRLTNPSAATPTRKTEKSTTDIAIKFECNVCNIWCNTQAQLEIHQDSPRHKHKAELAAKLAAVEANKGQSYDAWDPSG